MDGLKPGEMVSVANATTIWGAVSATIVCIIIAGLYVWKMGKDERIVMTADNDSNNYILVVGGSSGRLQGPPLRINEKCRGSDDGEIGKTKGWLFRFFKKKEDKRLSTTRENASNVSKKTACDKDQKRAPQARKKEEKNLPPGRESWWSFLQRFSKKKERQSRTLLPYWKAESPTNTGYWK